jgi:hypothetical protein
MADFQSFLFQSMQAIGLDEEAKKASTNLNNSTVNNKNNIPAPNLPKQNDSEYKTIDEPKSFKFQNTTHFNNNKNFTNSTMKTELTNLEIPFQKNKRANDGFLNMNMNNNILNSNPASSISSSGSESISSSLLPCPNDGNFNLNHHHNHPKMILNDFELEIEQNCSIIRSDSLTDACLLKTSTAYKSNNLVLNSKNDFNLKNSINQNTSRFLCNEMTKSRNYSIKSHDTERGVTSPKFFRRNNNNNTNANRITSNNLNNNRLSKLFLDDLDESVNENKRVKDALSDDLESNYLISSGFLDKNLSNSSQSEEEDFRRIQNNLVQTNSKSSKYKSKQNPIHAKDLSKNKIQRKYVVENQLFSEEEEELDEESDDDLKDIKSHNSSESDINEDEEQNQEDNEDIELENFCELTKSKVPWNSLHSKSVRKLFLSIKNKDREYPVLYSKNNHKISQTQVKKWFKILEHIYEKETLANDLNHKKDESNKGKKIGAVSSASAAKKSESSAIGSPKSISKLYTNVMKVKNKALNNLKSSSSQSSENQNNNDSKNNKAGPNPDHLYNEINDTDKPKHTSKSSSSGSHATYKKILAELNDKQTLKHSQNGSNLNLDDIETTIMQNVNFRRTISNLKSPERQILYNDWFKIVKKMEKDPKFDLEALIRTRGRFTDHEQISYRDKFVKTKSGLKTSQSEPVMQKSKPSEPQINAANTNNVSSNPKNCSISSATSKNKLKNENWDDVDLNETLMNNNNNSSSSKNTSKSNKKDDPNSSFKLTLEKSDINYIKDILDNKKGKHHVMNELSSKLTKNGKKTAVSSNNLSYNFYFCFVKISITNQLVRPKSR